MPAEPAFLSLAGLSLAGAAPDSRPVGSDGTDRRAWLARVAGWRDLLASLPGGDVALHLDDALDFAAALFGAWQAGRRPWLPGDTLPATLAALAPSVTHYIGNFPGALPAPADGSPASGRELDPRQCRLVLFTSGSSGEPVAVEKRLEQLQNEVAALEAQFGAQLTGARVEGTVSQQHIYGLLFRVLWPLAAGRPLHRRRRIHSEELAALGPEPLLLVSSPAHLKRLPDNQDWTCLRQGLRAVFCSGGPLPADAAHAVRQLWGQEPIEVYGSTETGGIAWRRGGGPLLPWQPLPGVQVRVEDGRLAIRSAHLAEDAWYRSQDRARPGPEGSFELLGRADRILKIEERRISLDAIERRLAASPLLSELKVLPLPGPRTVLGVAAVPSEVGRQLLETEGRGALSKALRAWLEGHADPVALPRRWRFLDALPTDAQGKAGQHRLLELFRPRMPEPHWLRRTPTEAELELQADAGLAGFQGHFPQQPILPGVVMLDWALRLGREAFGLEGSPQGMEAIKFQQLVRPGQRLRLQLSRLPDALAFRFESERGVHASGRLSLPGANDG
ncbi:AMP-binding protein [Arenimonas fontis]|uniref:AMP-binding protein n=1 Tax=Arenimonas fontis TaxID=2608255 RepID=A0A5B2ZD53_9GAMM|nr:AMP-binding protein [Arenimonas fontis]KAA2285947.1 AMP-binding protein [Arenimonas fontis]